jgi:hypothetical protein
MIVIGGQIINAEVDEPVVITKEIAPLEDISSRTGFYSKTFSIVGDTEANKVFNHLFDTNIIVQNTSTENFTPDFNPNLKASFQHWVDDLVTFQGFCKLDNITIEDEKVVYHLTAFGGAGEFFEEVGEKRLGDLDISAYNHSFTRANVVASWSNDYTDGYVYPMIDYGHKYQRNWWSWTEFRPAVFVKAVWDQIFTEAGWSYESTFLSTDNFEKLIIPSPSASVKLTNSEINDLTFTVANDAPFSIPNSRDLSLATPFEFPLDTGSLLANVLQNTSGTEWDTSSYDYTAAGDVTCAFRIKFIADVEYVGASPISSVGAVRAKFSIIRNRGGVYRRLETFEIGNYFTFTFFSTTLSAGSTSTNTEDINLTTSEHDIEDGDIIFVSLTDIEIQTVGGAGMAISGIDGDWNINVQAGSLFGNVVNPTMKNGQTVTLARAIPDWTQREFMRNISKMFNLYIEQTGDRTLLIEPRDEGYLQSTKEDWTDILAYDKERKITPMGELNKKEYYFTWNEDDDIWNTIYTDSWDGDIYGDKRVYVNNDFQTDVEEIKLDFAPTVLSNSKAGNIPNNRVISDMSFYKDDGLPEIQEAKPRIIYYGGLISGDPWTLVNGNQVGAATDVIYTTYPYAGHLDNPITPTYDFLWFFPKNIFYNRAYGSSDYPQYPNRNLYTLYWYRFIQEITDKDSKIFEGWFDLSYYDWVNLSFRKLYHFLDADWRLVSVSDYDLEKGGLTYCKFLKAGAWVNPTYDRYKLNTGYGETDDNGDTLPFIYRGEGSGGNKFPQEKDWGDGNTIGGRVGFVYGDANLIGTGTAGFALMNASGNNVQASGAVLINTDGRDVFRDNEVWINDINYERYQEFTFDNSVFNTLAATPIQFLPDLEDNQFYDITRITEKLDYDGTAYADGGVRIIKTVTSGTTLGTLVGSMTGTADAVYYSSLTPPLSPDLGEGVEIMVDSTEFTGSGGDVTYRVYYRIIET